MIPCNDNPTRFFFRYALPALSLSFFTYGVLPIVCLRLKLVQEGTGVHVITTNDDIMKSSGNGTGLRVIESVVEEQDDETTTD